MQRLRTTLTLALLTATLGACVPSRSAVFGPVERDVAQRVGVTPRWGDERIPAAITALLARPLDRDAAVRIALASNRRLQATYDELGIAAGDVASATVLAPTEVDLQYKGHDGGELEIEVIQDILDLLQLPQRRGAASAQLAAARARAVAATVMLVASVERAVVDVAAAQQDLELRQTAFDAASASADIVERMRAAGNAPELALVRERDQRERLRIELARAQLEVEVAREALNAVLGLTGADTRWTLTERLPDAAEAAPALDGLERDAVAASLDLAALSADADAAAGRLGIARTRAWLPALGVGVATSRSNDHWDVGPALSVGLPIFDQQQGPRARATAELRRTRNEATATAIELRAHARATRQRVLQAHAEARHLRTVVLPLRQRILDEAVKQYNAMNASSFELLTARRELVDAGRQYIDALRRFHRAAADTRALQRGAMPAAGADERAPMTAPAGTPAGH